MSKRIKKIWITKKGDKIPIEEMDDSHILNGIKLFERTGQRELQVEWLKEERDKRLGIVDEPINDRFEILDLRKGDEDGM